MGRRRMNREYPGKEWNRRGKRLFAAGARLGAAGVGLLMAARKAEGFAEWYGEWVYPVLVGSVGRCFGVLPFSASEVFLYLVLAGAVWQGVRHRRRLFYLASFYFMCASLILFLYAANCGVNYYRRPFSAWFVRERKSRREQGVRSFCGFVSG